MSHIHIPDGVLPLWTILVGWLVSGAILTFAARSISGKDIARKLPLLGVMAAVMVVSMMLEVVPIAYHVNLSVITGIILGPGMSFIAAFIVNVILALFGHGGLTVIGLNTLVIGTETTIGYYLFRAATRIVGSRLGIGRIAAVTTMITLMLSSAVMIGIVGISNIDPAEQTPFGGQIGPEELSFKNPFGNQILAFEVFPRDEPARTTTDLATFVKLVVILGVIGWVIEASITGLIARYLHRVRPDLLTPRV